MSMIKRGASTGRIEQYTKTQDDSAIVCQACMRVIVSKTNLENGRCPYCHNDINDNMSELEFESSAGEDIAIPC